MEMIKRNAISILLGLIFATCFYMGINAKHKRELLEIARVSQFIGCLQVTQGMYPAVCLKLVEATQHSKIIKDTLDSKEDDGKLIIEQSKKLRPPEEVNGNNI